MAEAHWPQVETIYRAGIATGHATFETQPPSWVDFDRAKLSEHRLVAVSSDGTVLAWAAVTAVSERCVYSGVVEHSVYVDPLAQGRGVGRQLLESLASSTEAAGIWTIQSGVFEENVASLALHAAVDFRQVGIRRGVGRMTYGPLAGRWRDVVLLERRSGVVGVD